MRGMNDIDIGTFLEASPRGTGAAIAKRLGVHPVMLSQWAAKTNRKPIPEDRAPALERETGFVVRCEVSCPDTRWVRIDDPDWPHGKPLIDKSPVQAEATAQGG